VRAFAVVWPGFQPLAVEADGHIPAPGRDADGQAALGGGCAADPELGQAVPRETGHHIQAEPAGGQRRGDAGLGEMVQVQHVTSHRGDVVLERREQAHDVRRAAGAGEPPPAPAWIVVLEMIAAPLQRVDVEEPLPVR